MSELFHFTCHHHAHDIAVAGFVVPARELVSPGKWLPSWADIAWFTDMERGHPAAALGLHRVTLRCDRTENRFTVSDAADVVWWPDFVRAADKAERAWMRRLEGSPGARPAHWYVSPVAVPVVPS